MPSFEHDGATIHYEVRGEGPALLAVAPGGMRSAAALWNDAPLHPRGAFKDQCTVITMDQRNAGASTGPVASDHGWHTYLADQLALLDHLGIERFAYIGMCIGGSYGLALAHAVPERVRGAILLQPIGLDDNRDAFFGMFDGWRTQIASEHPEIDDEGWAAMRAAMYERDFVFSLDRDQVASIETPLLVMRGNDLFHPASTSEEIVRLAPNAELVEEWKEGAARDAAVARARAFLAGLDS